MYSNPVWQHTFVSPSAFYRGRKTTMQQQQQQQQQQHVQYFKMAQDLKIIPKKLDQS